MKISTDAVLLGGLAESENPKMILDIGTGTGVIALMLAQRFPDANIEAVEFDEKAAIQAGENFAGSKFDARLTIHQERIQDFATSKRFDLIVSNPPYFTAHLKSKGKERNQALHTDMLSFEDLVNQVIRLLADRGRFWLILPPYESTVFQDLARKKGLFSNQIFRLKDKPEKQFHREVVEFSFKEKGLRNSNILLKNQDGSPSESYSKLVSGFLLDF
jgi:tRNA1Val (adenine37-N6)-methyltransferase